MTVPSPHFVSSPYHSNGGHGRGGNSYIPHPLLGDGVSAGYAPSEVPLYENRETVEDQYAAAEADGEPFFAIERYEDGFAITYDLLPAGSELAEPAVAELDEQVTREVEAIVGDASRPTSDVSRSIGNSLGQLSFFISEESAREVAATVSTLVLDEANWVAASPSDPGSGAGFGRET